MQTFTIRECGFSHEFEVEYLGESTSDDPCYRLRVRCRCLGPFADDWQEFDTEPEWFRQRGLTPPQVSGTEADK